MKVSVADWVALVKERDELKANYKMLTIESDDILVELQTLKDAVKEVINSPLWKQAIYNKENQGLLNKLKQLIS